MIENLPQNTNSPSLVGSPPQVFKAPHSVTFWGAARCVTGSMHLVQLGDFRILLDCGVHTGNDRPAITPKLPFSAAKLDAVILSHNHTDHVGRIHELFVEGYAGPIYCTYAAQDILEVQLLNSARIQDQEFAARKSVNLQGTAHRLSTNLARKVVDHCVPQGFGETVEILPGIGLTLYNSGHILGSAMPVLSFRQGTRDRRLAFTGDIGRSGLPYLKPAQALPPSDYAICESTYGGRIHETREQMGEKLAKIFHDTMEREGKILIPAFSLGRTQAVIHHLSQWMREGVLPQLPIQVDSPLGRSFSLVYRDYPDELATPEPKNSNVDWLVDPEEAFQASKSRGTSVIIASGGMLEGGKILKHLRNHIDDPRSALVLVSFQAPGTLGEKVLEKHPTLTFHGRTWNKWLDVQEVSGFSGHGDQRDLCQAMMPLVEKQGTVKLVHGEKEGMTALSGSLKAMGLKVGMPDVGEVWNLEAPQ